MSIELNCNLYKSTKIHGFLTISDWYDISGNTIRDILIKDCYILQSMLSISGNVYSNYYDKNYVNGLSLQGVKGDKGDTGATGATDATGLRGIEG